MSVLEADAPTAPYKGGTYELLEDLYREYNRREYVSPDPLEFLYHYDDPSDREVVGLIASSLAYGRVASILSSVRRVLDVLGHAPAETLLEYARRESSHDEMARRLGGFVHRFTACEEMSKFLHGIGRALIAHGSLENLFMEGLSEAARPAPGAFSPRCGVLGAMEHFTRSLLSCAALDSSHLLPRPSKGSACKRLALYVRWMARQDDVDPGGWRSVPACDIIVPLDTHMFRIATGLGFVTRKSADGAAALDATDGFRRLRPDDPARYDFALTRFGIRTGMSVEELLAKFRAITRG
ncbi:MAG: TIGR02757 family protein [Synergistaceae bacterium]|jgi:uncharacterized protein (TIGR02757 family)|nr:TIGR02757 family protein [Synergistaceae bacterium]